ncbi:histamine H3 receptor [Trichechus manatus latirostris]|uniref:Histamine H3 receptor n=1 Tax=Trichechus manatus latirostris TaxID=127582 RepID=A0A2Y9D9T4_TRIMA|nr:histamine H3 receptor [Trichechus manatus latirostris]
MVTSEETDSSSETEGCGVQAPSQDKDEAERPPPVRPPPRPAGLCRRTALGSCSLGAGAGQALTHRKRNPVHSFSQSRPQTPLETMSPCTGYERNKGSTSHPAGLSAQGPCCTQGAPTALRPALGSVYHRELGTSPQGRGKELGCTHDPALSTPSAALPRDPRGAGGDSSGWVKFNLSGAADCVGGATGWASAWTAVLAALMALLIVATVLGNALVMLAFVADSSLRTQNNFFLLNLAISDFLVGAFCIPLYVPYVLTGRWTFGRGLCKLWLVVDYLLCATSVFNIVLISYDRFLSVTRAVSYRAQQGDTRRAVRKMVLVWVLAFLLYGPAILSWEYLSGGSSIPEGHCYAEFFYNWYFLITASTLEFFTPFLSVTFFNLSIYLNIQRRTRIRLDGIKEASGLEPPPEAQPSPPLPSCWGCWHKGRGETLPLHQYAVAKVAPGTDAGETALGGGSGGGGAGVSPTSSSGSSSRGGEWPRSLKRSSKPSASSASLEKRMKMVSQSITQRFRLSRDKKVAKSLAVIVSIFGLCWAPYTLLMIIRAACHGHCIPNYWYETSFWLLWANSAVNPVLYPLCHYSFRRAFTKLLCPHKLKLQPHSSLEHCWKKMKKKTRP